MGKVWWPVREGLVEVREGLVEFRESTNVCEGSDEWGSVQNGANDTTPQLQDGHNAAQTMMTVDTIGAGDEQVRNGKH